MNIVIVDDVSLIRIGLANLLQAGGHTIVGEADAASSAKDVVLSADPDLVVLDYYLIDSTGLQVYEVIKENQLRAKSILLTGTHDIRALSNIIFNTEINAVVQKGENSSLLRIVEQVQSGKTYIDPNILSEVLQYKRIVNELNTRQEEILFGMIRGLTNEQISEGLNLSVRSVSNQKAKIRKYINQKKLNQLRRILFKKHNEPVSPQSIYFSNM